MNILSKNRAEPGYQLVLSLIEELLRGRDLILRLNDEIYTAAPEDSGSVGGHFRHIFDFVSCVLSGIESGNVDYNRRERDIRIETNRNYAAERCFKQAKLLSDLKPSVLSRNVNVVSEVDREMILSSSVAREFEFVRSHTIHHHALIKERLKDVQIAIDRDFGVAPSTLEYWNRLAA